LTIGARYAKDKKFGEENIYTMIEVPALNFAYSPVPVVLSPTFTIPANPACAAAGVADCSASTSRRVP